MNSQELPSGWISVRLGDLCSTSSGGTPLRSKKRYYGGHIPWIKSGELEDNLILNSEERISKEGLENSNAKIYPKGTVVVALYGATAGRTGILGMDAATNQAVCTIFTDELVLDKMYLFYFLRSKRDDFLKRAYGEAQRNISQGIIRDTKIPLAPLTEQKRIVAMVESLFAETKTAREALEKVKVLLTRFRQSILAKAFRGELTQRDPNDEPAQKLLEKIRREREKGKRTRIIENQGWPSTSLPELPETWIWITIRELETFIGSGLTPRGGRKVYVEEGILFIRSQNVHPDGLHLENIAHITPETHAAMKRTRVQPNDVLLNLTGASIGRSTYIPKEFGEANVNQHVCIIRTGWWMVPAYLSYFLNSPSAQNQIYATQSGVTREGLNYTQVRSLRIPFAPLSEQRRIVATIDEAFYLVDRVDATVKKAKEQTEKIDHAILTKAFRGELVPQDPNDEPSSILLQRIKPDTAKMRMKTRKKKPEIRPPSTVLQTQAKSLRSIRSILEEMGQAPVDQVFRASGLSVSEFWDELKIEIDADRIEQIRKGNSVFLKVKS